MPARDLTVEIDLTDARRQAKRVAASLNALRAQFDLTVIEYTRTVRIAPTALPHSHPVLTLNTFTRSDVALLCTYVHEQMHWYVTWFSHAHPAQWEHINADLRATYLDPPDAPPEAAADAASTYLHLIVNFLEIEVACQHIDRSRVVAHVGALPFYRWMYRTVLEDDGDLRSLYNKHGLLPIRPATEFSDADLTLAARMEETPST